MLKIWENRVFRVILSLGAIICLQFCIGIRDGLSLLSYTNSVWSGILFAGYLYALTRIVNKAEWKTTIVPHLKIGFGFCFLFIGAMVAGVQLDAYGRVDFSNIMNYLTMFVLALGGAPFVAWVFVKLQEVKRNKTAEVVDKRYFYKIMLVLFLAYIPVLLAAWPGFFCYDAEVETYMVFTDKYSAHHPVTHVVLLGWIMKIMYKIIPSYNVGIAVYLLLQMLVVSACFAYMMTFLKRIGVRRWIVNTGIAFLALFPTVSMFVCCTTKDVYFSAGIVLFTTLLLEMVRDEGTFWNARSKKRLFALSILMILLFRNNGIYAFVVFLPFFVLMFKKYWKKWSPILIGVFLFYFLLNITMNAIFNVKPGEKAEMLCVPMQQLARVHAEAKECFGEDDLEVMYSLIPEVILNNYKPKLADSVKVNFLEDNFKAEPGKYIDLWWRMGLKRPDVYVNSILMNTYGYWYPDTIIDAYTNVKMVERYYDESSYFFFETERPGMRKSLIPVLERFYERISLEIYQQKVPVVSMLFSMGFWKWVYLFMLLYLWRCGYKKQGFAFGLMGIIYLTVLLGPTAIVRYVLYFFFCAPLVLALLFDTKAFAEEKIESDKV